MLKASNKLVVAPATSYDITLEEAKAHLRIYDSADDTYVLALIAAATEVASSYIGEFICSTDVEAYYTHFDKRLELPNRFVKNIYAVSYKDKDNAVKQIPCSDYFVENAPGHTKVLVYTGDLTPSLSSDYSLPVVVEYEAEVPECYATYEIQQAILLYISEMYYNREGHTDKAVNTLPLASERLLAKLKRNMV
jgi:uncharacterized phiE125 gp8 family phage protein